MKKIIKGAIIGGVIGIAAPVVLAVGNTTIPILVSPNTGCKYKGSPRPNCSSKWFKDKKGEIFVLTWSDGDKTTIRQTSKKGFLINEKNAGTVISTTPYLTFKNTITGSTISLPPSWFGLQRVNQLVANDGNITNKKTSEGQFWKGQIPGTGTLAIGAIGGLIAGGALSLLFKGKSEANTKSSKSGITESTSVDETIKTKPELPVEPIGPIPPIVAEKVIETPPPVEEKQVADKQNYQRFETDAEPKSYASHRSIDENDDDLANEKIKELKEKIDKLERNNKMERQRGYLDSYKTITKQAKSNDKDPDNGTLKGLLLIGILGFAIGGGALFMNSGSRYGLSNKGFCQKTKNGYTICIKEENISCNGDSWCQASGTSKDLTGKEEHWTSRHLFGRQYSVVRHCSMGEDEYYSTITCRAARRFGKL